MHSKVIHVSCVMCHVWALYFAAYPYTYEYFNFFVYTHTLSHTHTYTHTHTHTHTHSTMLCVMKIICCMRVCIHDNILARAYIHNDQVTAARDDIDLHASKREYCMHEITAGGRKKAYRGLSGDGLHRLLVLHRHAQCCAPSSSLIRSGVSRIQRFAQGCKVVEECARFLNRWRKRIASHLALLVHVTHTRTHRGSSQDRQALTVTCRAPRRNGLVRCGVNWVTVLKKHMLISETFCPWGLQALIQLFNLGGGACCHESSMHGVGTFHGIERAKKRSFVGACRNRTEVRGFLDSYVCFCLECTCSLRDENNEPGKYFSGT